MTFLAVGSAALLLALAVRLRRTYAVVRVDGSSMTPILADGDRLLARRVRADGLSRDEIVIVRSPLPIGGPYLIKRIVALAGDPVPNAVRPAVPDDRVPYGQVVLLGDNPAASYDSREHGYFRAADVLAVTIRRMRS
ncbi:S26 family signal peptidase [Nonomuraea sp. NPDC048826]|uniref:S26 family signal peptidase n=1 Tax=Nonomuraea sp. NPDC048826 TaxID=3364347 RepID=UPI00371A416D